MGPGANGAVQPKPPRVLRWVVVLVLVWVVTAGYFVVSTEAATWSQVFGGGEATADPVTASSLVVVVVLVQIARRVRSNNRQASGVR